jgi:hypothetical protein
MCARLEFMFQGYFTAVTVRPGGRPVVPIGNRGTYDVRHFFPSDDRIGMVDPMKVDAELRLLRQAADELWRRLTEYGAQTIQCEKGESRSPRVLGAFLIVYMSLTAAQALQRLVTTYRDNRTDGCTQPLSGSVQEWLERFYDSKHRRLG